MTKTFVKYFKHLGRCGEGSGSPPPGGGALGNFLGGYVPNWHPVLEMG